MADAERMRPELRNFLLPYVEREPTDLHVSVPLYVPMGVVAAAMYWKWRRRRRDAAGFQVATAGPGGEKEALDA